jgi:hypothetical protein
LKGEGPFSNELVKLIVIFVIEGRISRQQNEEDDAARPEVHLRPILLPSASLKSKTFGHARRRRPTCIATVSCLPSKHGTWILSANSNFTETRIGVADCGLHIDIAC